jgi:hypothetical protein
MSTAELTRLLAEVTPAELRERIAELDRQRSALTVLLRAAVARHMGRNRKQESKSVQTEGVGHAD